MNKVPEMISSKDLSYISDAFEWNFTLAKKSLEYSKLVKDSKISKILKTTFEIHKKICDDLITIMEGE